MGTSPSPQSLFERIFLAIGHSPEDAKSVATSLGTLVITVAYKRLFATTTQETRDLFEADLAMGTLDEAKASLLHQRVIDHFSQEKVGIAFRDATELVLGTYLKELSPSLTPQQQTALKEVLAHPTG